jgi:hypothetical protein
VNSQQIGYEGSDEEIRSKVTTYLSSFLQCMQKMMIESSQESPKKPPEFVADYGSLFIKTWQSTNNYSHWLSTIDRYRFPESIKTSHPCHGAEFSYQFAAKMSEFGKSVTQQAKAFSQGSSSTVKDDGSKSSKQGSAMFSNVGTYIKKIGKSLISDEEADLKSQNKEEFEVVNLDE